VVDNLAASGDVQTWLLGTSLGCTISFSDVSMFGLRLVCEL
jgi:hypothetical protein